MADWREYYNAEMAKKGGAVASPSLSGDWRQIYQQMTSQPGYTNTFKPDWRGNEEVTAPRAGAPSTKGYNNIGDTSRTYQTNAEIGDLKAERDRLWNIVNFADYGWSEQAVQNARNRLAELERQKDQMWVNDKEQKFGNLASNADYAAQTMSNGDLSKFSEWDKLKGASSYGAYRYALGGDYADQVNKVAPDRNVAYMTDEEKKNLIYLYNTQGAKAVQEYYDYIESALNERKAQAAKAAMKADVADDNVLEKGVKSAESVPLNLIGGVAGFGSLVAQNAKKGVQEMLTGKAGKPVDYNSDFMTPSATAGNITEAVTESIQNPIGQFLYQTGMSMANSAAVGALTAMGIPNAAWLLGASAAVDGAKEAKERGATDSEALIMGTYAGIAEEFFEEYSIERFLNTPAPQDAAQFVRNIVYQSLGEGSEEVATTLANTMADAVVMGDKSKFEQSRKQYLAQGYSAEEAKRLATIDFAKEIGMDALGGAVSGAAFGTAGNFRANRLASQRGAQLRNQALDMQEEGKSYGKGAVSEQLANKERLSDREVAFLEQNLEKDRNRQQSEGWSAVSNRIEQETGEKNLDLANAVAKQLDNQKLTADEKALVNSELGQKIIGEYRNDAEWAEPLKANGRQTDFTGDADRVTWAEEMRRKGLASKETRQMLEENVGEDWAKQVNGEAVERVNAVNNLSDEFRKRTHDNGALLDAIQKTGQKVEVMDFGNNLIGRYNTETDTIELNSRAENSEALYDFVLKHELTHALEKTKAYQGLRDLAIADQLDLEESIRLVQQEYANNGITLDREGALSELTADYVGKTLGDTKRLTEMVNKDRNVATKFLHWVKNVLRNLTTTDTKEYERLKKTEKFLEEALREKAAGQKNTASENTQGGKQFSIETIEGTNQKYVKADRQVVVKGDSLSEQANAVARYLEMNIRRGEDVPVFTSDGNLVYLTEDTVGKATYRNENPKTGKPIGDNLYRVKLNAELHIDELMQVAKKTGSKIDVEEHAHRDADSWDYYTAYFEDSDGKYYRLGISVKKLQNIGAAYNVGKFNEKIKPTVKVSGSSSTKGGAQDGRLNANVANPSANVKENFADAKKELSNSGVDLVDDSAVKFSLATWTGNEKARTAKALVKAGYEKAQVDKWIEDVNSVSAMIAADRERLDFSAADNQTMLKDNQEYVKTLDASTLCAKRLLYQGTFNAVQRAMPNTVLTSDDLIHLREVMAQSGDEVPCGVCYVESRRRNLGTFAGRWLDEYDGAYKPTLNDVTTSDGLETLRHEHPDTYEDFMKAMRKIGANNPKVVELRTAYRGEIGKLVKSTVKKLNDAGGLRVQSFSDFESVHLLDMMQAVADMSAKGLKSQAYTKVPNFALAFGGTGMKINLSLIAEGSGFDADGNLAFSSKEGMDFNEALRVREMYPKDVGTIIVGVSKKHILACMADDRIDFIIPFHKSGWAQKDLDSLGLTGYNDFTYGQNEHYLSDKKRVKENILPSEYWNYGISGKENAEKYLEICKERKIEPKFSEFLHDNGDGSWSLQKDGSTDGYWKTLIDFKMYDNDGNGAPQRVVTPDFNMEESRRILNEYEGGANSLPVDEEVVKKFVDEYKENHPRKQYSTAKIDDAYMKAVNEGDTKSAQRMVDDAAKKAGYDTPRLYHGTNRFGFTKFEGDTIWLTSDKTAAQGYGKTGYADVRKISDSYIKDDGTNDTLIQNAKNVLKQDYREITDTDIRDTKEKFVTESGELSDRINEAWDKAASAWEKSGFELPEEINSKVWNLLALPGDINSWAEELFEGDFTEEYTKDLDNDLNVFERDKEEVQKYFRERRKEMTGAEDLYRLVVGYDLTDFEIEARYQLERAAVRDGFLMSSNGHYVEAEALRKSVENAKNIGAYELYGKFGDKPLIVDANGSFWMNIKVDEWGKTLSTDAIVKEAKERGYTSVVIKNVMDPAMNNYSVNKAADDYIFFDSNNVKSADAVTYDDNGNVIPVSERFSKSNTDIRYSTAQISNSGVDTAKRLEYENLVSKSPMQLTEIDSKRTFSADSRTRKSIIDEAISNAERIGKRDNHNAVSVYVEDIGADVVLSRKGLMHGLDRRLSLNASATIQAGSILKNSILINTMNPRSEIVDKSYVLLGAAHDQDNHVSIVRFVVNRYNHELQSVDVLYALNAKKESAAHYAPTITENPLRITDSTISIAQLLDLARENFPDVLPESVLRHYGIDRRPEGRVGESVLYSLTQIGDKSIQDTIDRLVKDFGAFPKGELATNDVQIPQETDKGSVRRFVRTAAESRHADEQMVENLKEGVVNDTFTYRPETDKDAVNFANETLEKNGYDGAVGAFRQALDDGKVDKKTVVLGERLMVEAYQNKNAQEAMQLTAEVAEAATRAGQIVQAMKILKRMGKTGQLLMLQEHVKRWNKNEANEGPAKRRRNKNKVDIEKIDTEIKQIRTDLDTHGGDTETLVKRTETARDEMHQILEELKNNQILNGTLDALKQETKQSEAVPGKLQKKNDRLQTKVDEAARKAVLARDEANRTEAEMRKKTDVLEGTLDALNEENARYEGLPEKYRRQLERLERSIELTGEKIVRNRADAERVWNETHEQIELLQATLEAIQEENRRVAAEKQRYETMQERLQKQLNKKVANLEKNRIDLENRRAAKYREMADFLTGAKERMEIERKPAQIDMMKKRLAELEQRRAQLSGEIYLSEETVQNILNQTTQSGLDEAVEQAYAELASQVPANWQDKWNALRYMGMLTNPTTHIRNILGNAAFIPAIELKNLYYSGLQTVLNGQFRGEDIRRTAVLTKADEHLKELAKAEYAENAKMIQSSGKYNPADTFRDARTVFDNKALEFARKLNGEMLEKEDAVFLEQRYVSAYAQMLKARGYDGLSHEQQTALRKEASEWAMREAWRATYRDASHVAEVISKLERDNAVSKVLVGGVLPFKKTPINVLRRGLDYSPVGIMKGVVRMTRGVESGRYTAAQGLDYLASGLSGTSIMLLGMFLKKLGLLTGGGDDKDKANKYKKQVAGWQPYSLKIGDNTYTLDWMAPTSLPLFTGVELYESLTKDGFSADAILNAGKNMLNPMVEMSMLSSLASMITSMGYGSTPGEKLTNGLVQVLTSYATQAVPTFGGRINRIFDGASRNTYYKDKTSAVPADIQTLVRQAMNKTPGLSQKIQPKLDVWGREQRDSLGERTLEALISPGYYNAPKLTKVDEELIRLYEDTGESSVFPAISPSTYYKYNGENRYMSADEYTKFCRALGQTQFNLLNSMMGTSAYKSASNTEKAEMISDIYGYAKYAAKKVITPGYSDSAYDRMYAALKKTGIPAYEYMQLKEAASYVTENGTKTKSNESVKTALDASSLNQVQKAEMFAALQPNAKNNPYKF